MTTLISTPALAPPTVALEVPVVPPKPYTLIVVSHLGWDWVWQRPQHLLSRMARRHPVLFVPEPWITEVSHPPVLNIEPRPGNVTLAWPVFSQAQADAAGGPYELIGRLISDRIKGEGLQNPVFWLYTPMAAPVLEGHDDAVVVFDAMDELAAFKFAPAELRAREEAVMRRADLVFTGGQSLYEARKNRNPHVFCFPSGVERAHFAKALDPALPEAPAIADLPHPRIGYYGVIDERLDLDLLRDVAALRPNYEWVMVGPTVKIDPTVVPQATNLHYPGKQEYADLPTFLKGFDVCMMPFALNESTRFISPTKTLEYMAAHKPIVSTPIKDVVGSYSHIVAIADTAEAFVAAVDAALHETKAQVAARRAAEEAVLATYEWDNIASEMLGLIDACQLAQQETTAAAAPARA
ncbi:MAG TPA: glycosyltransferase [Chloroflexia bacterium]|nr:glycosyltransferase [Chloroflexia bacterium]